MMMITLTDFFQSATAAKMTVVKFSILRNLAIDLS